MFRIKALLLCLLGLMVCSLAAESSQPVTASDTQFVPPLVKELEGRIKAREDVAKEILSDNESSANIHVLNKKKLLLTQEPVSNGKIEPVYKSKVPLWLVLDCLDVNGEKLWLNPLIFACGGGKVNLWRDISTNISEQGKQLSIAKEHVYFEANISAPNKLNYYPLRLKLTFENRSQLKTVLDEVVKNNSGSERKYDVWNFERVLIKLNKQSLIGNSTYGSIYLTLTDKEPSAVYPNNQK